MLSLAHAEFYIFFTGNFFFSFLFPLHDKVFLPIGQVLFPYLNRP